MTLLDAASTLFFLCFNVNCVPDVTGADLLAVGADCGVIIPNRTGVGLNFKLIVEPQLSL